MTRESTGIDWNTGVPLARGGSGEVVRAFSPTLGRDIAIKYLRVEEPGAIERMLREARTQAGFQHPHILSVHATGTHLGRHYIAMDVVDGQPLDRALLAADVETRLEVFDQVLDAMACAHAAGVVHRDLKPANLLVEQRDGGPHAWVMDFGLARRPEDATLTVAGDALGTPGYMAPEQARGAEGVDPRSDVYALGVVLYQLMSGRLPYTGDSPMALVMQAAEGRTVPVTEIRRRLPADLARIVVRCLEADPARRYPDAGALRRDLQAYRDGRSVDAPVLGRRYRLQRWARINPWRARLALALAVVMVTGGAVLTVLAEQNRRALNAASALIADAERARGDWYVDQLLPLHDQRPAEARARATIDRLEDARADLTEAATARVDAALADLLDAIGEPTRAFERARDAWRGGVRTPAVAARAVQARLQQFGARRLELSLTASPDSLAELLERERRLLADAVAPFRMSLEAGFDARLERALADGPPETLPMDPVPTAPGEWQRQLLDLQPMAAAAIERLNEEGERAIAELDRVEGALNALLASVRSYRPGYRLGCQIAAARQSLRTMQGAPSGDAVPREACERGLMLDANDPALLASSSMQSWLRAKDLRRSREPFERELARSIDQARTALEFDADNELAQLSLGSAMQILGRQQMQAGDDPTSALQSSLDWLGRVHEARPNDFNVMNNLAVTWSTISSARSGKGDSDGALRAERESLAWLERAAETAPEDRRLVHNMLYTRMSLLYQTSLAGEDPTAEGRSTAIALERLSEQHPDYITPANTQGLMWWTLGVWDARVGRDPAQSMLAALDAFDEALARRPDWESPQINRAGVMRQWYSLSRERPAPALESMADEALGIYASLEPVDAEKMEFGCLIAEILAARAGWRTGDEAVGLLDEAESIAALDRNNEWAHPDCALALARVGTLRRIHGEPGASILPLWETVRTAAEAGEHPDLLLRAAQFASAMDRPDLAEAWRQRVPAAFREAGLAAGPVAAH